MTDKDIILERLNNARKRLVDLSLRNRFLNYHPSRTRSLEIAEPDAQTILNVLVTQNKAVRLVARSQPNLFREETGSVDAYLQNKVATVFQIEEDEQKLNTKLLQIWRDAASIQEEQGINLLFVALGALYWYESEAASEARCAPLFFIPVLIEREQGSQFRIRYEGTELLRNLSLSEMLEQNFRMTLDTSVPASEDDEQLDLHMYFQQVKRSVANQKRWRVDENFAVVSFFNYTKYVMYRDLNPDNWQGERSPTNHSVLRVLLGEEELDNSGSIVPDNSEDLENYRPPEKALEVFDADSSQIAVLLQAKQAPVMIVEGPPGTGKSQTITNLIAEAIYEGQKVLFVSEKKAALEVVWRRLEEANIADACLELHSNKARKKSFYEQLKRVLEQSPMQYIQKQQELHRLTQVRNTLNAYCHALHSPLPNRGVTPYQCIAQMCRLGKEHKPFLGSFRIMKEWDQETFERKRQVVEKLQNYVKQYGIPTQSPLWGCGLKSIQQEEYEQILDYVVNTARAIENVVERATAFPALSAEDVRRCVRQNETYWKSHMQQMEVVLRQYWGKWARWLMPHYWWWSRVIRQLWGHPVPEQHLIQVLELAKAVIDVDQRVDKLLQLLQATETWQGAKEWSYEDQQKWLHNLQRSDIEAFQCIARFNTLQEEARKENLQEYAEWAAKNPDSATELVNTIERAWYHGILTEAFQKYPVLAEFADEHEELIQQFRDLDQMLLQINRLRVATKHWERLPRHRSAGNLGKLQRELQKSRAHKPIRKIMQEAGEAVLAIKPVFMMSPLSVAMYLPPDAPQFDIVIFDEASQVKPEDAFGAILRAKRAIIVGDTKQLPPTKFFDRLTDDMTDDGEDEDVTIGIDSILDLTDSAIPEFHPFRRRLRWHYRSKHHSLIACSNGLFYDHSLIVAPNPETQSQQLGIVFRHLPDAVYERGGSRCNLKEAQAVAQAVIQHVMNTPNLSLGVAAFSIPQQQAIQDELERLRQSNPQYDRMLTEFDKYHQHEPLFVKNLETVQGDERDVIFISIGYGKDENGFLSMNFGPLNKEGGERRLNVLITRARARCEVFSSIRYSDLRVDVNTSAGLRALRTFLLYAETGQMDIVPDRQKEPMSPFEEAVLNFLREQGFQVEPQVGSAGFYIDIGVIDPNNPGRYVLGIECDGAHYHSHKTVRDRDRLRQQILEQRGWRIYRVWSTSWYRDPNTEKKRLLEAVKAAIELTPCDNEQINRSPLTAAKRTECVESPIVSAVNQSATLTIEPRHELEFSPYRYASVSRNFLSARKLPLACHSESAAIAKVIVEVVNAESPVHVEVLLWRIREALGLGRIGSRIREDIMQALKAVARSGRVRIDGDFVWKASSNSVEPRSRAKHPAAYKKINYIHPKEIQEAIVFAIHHSYGLSEDEVCLQVLKLFGFERSTETMRQAVVQQVRVLLEQGRIARRGAVLYTT